MKRLVPPPLLALLLALPLILGGCVAPTGSVDAAARAECDADLPCEAGLLCVKGRCVGCSRDRECAPDELCHPFQRRCELRACFARDCRRHDDCALGLFCVQGMCLPAEGDAVRGCAVLACAGNDGCPEGLTCHRTNGVCEEPLGCSADTDCDIGERCDAAAGRCAAACTEATVEADCGGGLRCLAGLCVDCLSDAECAAGLSCAPDTHRCESLGGCYSDRDCALPLVCNGQTRRCTVRPGLCSSSEACDSDEACDTTTGRCVPAACAADSLEPNETPGEAPLLQPGRYPDLTLCGGELDLYRVPLGAGDRLQALLEADATLPLELELRDDAGVARARGSLLVDGRTGEAATWVVAVRGADPYLRYGLRLAVSRGTPCAPDADEPNELPAQAAVLALGDSDARTLCPGDVDLFAVAVTAGQRVRATLSGGSDAGGSGAGAALALSLWDGAGQRLLAQASPSSGALSAEAALEVGTRLLVRVEGREPTVQASYALRVEVVTP